MQIRDKRTSYIVREIPYDKHLHIQSRKKVCVMCLYIPHVDVCGESETARSCAFCGLTRDLQQFLLGGPLCGIDEILGIVSCIVRRLL